MNIQELYDDAFNFTSKAVKMSGEGVQQNIDKLNALETAKYKLSNIMVELEAIISKQRLNELESIFKKDEYKEMRKSSTIASWLIEGSLAAEMKQYNMTRQLLNNVRSSLDVTRSILSAEKGIAQL